MPYCVLNDYCLVLIEGQEAETFLQGLLTQDVASITLGAMGYSALLNPQGRYEADMMVVRTGPQTWNLLIHKDLASTCERIFIRYKMRRLIHIHILTNVCVVAVWGEELKAQKLLQGYQGYLGVDPRLSQLGYRGWCALEQAEALFQGMPLEPAQAYHQMRWSFGIAEGPSELRAGKSIILEYNFDLLGALSWTKGCYIGQELMARTYHRGQVRKRLVPIASIPSSKQEQIEAGDILFDHASQELKKGTVAAFQGSKGFALVEVDFIMEKEKKTLATEKGVQVQIHAPQWLLYRLCHATQAGENQQ